MNLWVTADYIVYFLNSKHVHSQFWCLQWKTINWQGVSEPLTGGVRQQCTAPYLWGAARWHSLVLPQPSALWSQGLSAQTLPDSPGGWWYIKITFKQEIKMKTGVGTIGRQLTWRLAIGTEIVFPWWFMAVTSTTLLSSFAPSPRQIYKTASNICLCCV